MKKNNIDLAYLKFQKDLDYIIQSIEKNIEFFKNNIQNNQYNATTYPTLTNNLMFFLISLKDILITQRMFNCSADESERNLFLRSLALYIYEFLDDLKYFSGKTFEKELIQLKNNQDARLILYQFKVSAKKIRLKHNSFLADIRHNTIGHKDKNAMKLLKQIENLSHPQFQLILQDIIELAVLSSKIFQFIALAIIDELDDLEAKVKSPPTSKVF